MLTRHFTKIGARVAVAPIPRSTVRIDVQKDRRGEHFLIVPAREEVRFDVVDVRPDQKHLLLLVRFVASGRKHKYFCGFEERAWFVAAVPDTAGIAVSNVRTALEALKPPQVRERQARLGIRPSLAHSRRNGAFVRQGEWFFVPNPDYAAPEGLVLRHEPLRRNMRGKPHWCQELVRFGGELVYTHSWRRQVLSEAGFMRLAARDPETVREGWTPMRRNPIVRVRGRVTHSDHKTVVLPCWHRVLLNTEHLSPAVQGVAFLD